MALLTARLLRSTAIKGQATPFVMELPPYRMPTLRGLCLHTWERAWQYIKKAGTIILAISVLLWAAMTCLRVSRRSRSSLKSSRRTETHETDAKKASGNPDRPIRRAPKKRRQFP